MHEKIGNLFSQYEADKIHMNSTRWRISLIYTYNTSPKQALMPITALHSPWYHQFQFHTQADRAGRETGSC